MTNYNNKIKLLVWDIEASDLRPDWGRLLCIGWKWAGQKKTNIITMRQSPSNDILDDSYVVSAFQPIMEQAHAQITWFGSRYDMPFVRSRGLKHNMDYFADVPHIDLWKTCRYQMRLSRNGLANAGKFFLGKDEKTAIDPEIWQYARIGNKKALKEVEHHCVKDVEQTEKMYYKFRPYIKSHPNLTVITREMDNCPVCHATSDKLRNKGYIAKGLSIYRRWHCGGCGSYPLEGPLHDDKKKIKFRNGA